MINAQAEESPDFLVDHSRPLEYGSSDMGFLGNLIRRRVPLSSLPTDIAAAFLKNFAVDPQIRSEAYDINNLAELVEISIFFLSSVDCAFFSSMTSKDGGLMHVTAEMKVQFAKNIVESMPERKMEDLLTLIRNRQREYMEVFQRDLFPGDRGVKSALFMELTTDAGALNEYFRRFPGSKVKLMSALGKNAQGLRDNNLRCDMIFKHYVAIFYNVVDFFKNGIPIKMLEAMRKLYS